LKLGKGVKAAGSRELKMHRRPKHALPRIGLGNRGVTGTSIISPSRGKTQQSGELTLAKKRGKKKGKRGSERRGVNEGVLENGWNRK